MLNRAIPFELFRVPHSILPREGVKQIRRIGAAMAISPPAAHIVVNNRRQYHDNDRQKR